jgi:hypothetical protein
MILDVTVSTDDIKRMIIESLYEKFGNSIKLNAEDITIKVKSKQNYRDHEWENGDLQVSYHGEKSR